MCGGSPRGKRKQGAYLVQAGQPRWASRGWGINSLRRLLRS
jgi:hypothetical protein